jgi:hypothetical protein
MCCTGQAEGTRLPPSFSVAISILMLVWLVIYEIAASDLLSSLVSFIFFFLANGTNRLQIHAKDIRMYASTCLWQRKKTSAKHR